MAVIIKDINVPKSCKRCVFRECNYFKNDCCVALGRTPLPSKEHLTEDFKYLGCPIKPVDKYSPREELGRHLAQNMMGIKEER